MLSNPTNTLQTRQRQHRRQNSTPTAFEKVEINSLPNIPKYAAHRRGMSMDQRRKQTQVQDTNLVSNTNTGYQTTQQHILRETQQHRPTSPGFHYPSGEMYLQSPLATPTRKSFDTGYTDTSCQDQFSAQYALSEPVDALLSVNSSTADGANIFNMFSSDALLTPSSFLDFSAEFDDPANKVSKSGQSSKRSSRRISGGILDRVAQFETLSTNQRPMTPPNQNETSCFPLTPGDTPYRHSIKSEQTNQRFLDGYDASLEKTIKPKPSQRSRTVFEDMRRAADQDHTLRSSRNSRVLASNAYDSAPMPTGDFMNMSNLDINIELLKSNAGEPDTEYSPAFSTQSTSMSYASSPEISNIDLFGNHVSQNASQKSLNTASSVGVRKNSVQASSPASTTHRRSESVCSINIVETITETGISIDDIATFISGPDPVDNKWLCLFPGCKKRFGRKENIKSHVQTHLGDRQFQCPHCQKCFVRQHDLKRHAKIHSGVKPYPCQCGNSFARHDALTRHRQRGMCIGAFEGIVKKTARRGRPRKHRPDDETRLEKSSKTRARDNAMSSASSTSAYSDSNYGQSPQSDLDDILDGKAFGNYEMTQSSSALDNSQYSQPHTPHEIYDYASPETFHNAHSPSVFSVHSPLSEHLPSHPASPADSVYSQYHTPPELCESSSSPAGSIRCYEGDKMTHQENDFVNLSGLGSISEQDDEMFLEAFNVASHDMTRLEREPEILMGKFDDIVFDDQLNEDFFKVEGDLYFNPQ